MNRFLLRRAEVQLVKFPSKDWPERRRGSQRFLLPRKAQEEIKASLLFLVPQRKC